MSITATVENGTIKLPVHVPDGTQVEITVPRTAAGPESERNAPAGGEEPTIMERYAWLNEFVGCIKDGPTDMAAEHDHYAHGTPKRGGQ